MEFPAELPNGAVVTEVRAPLLVIGINRPSKRNGFTPTMFRELAEAYTRLDDDPALRVGVLCAAAVSYTHLDVYKRQGPPSARAVVHAQFH